MASIESRLLAVSRCFPGIAPGAYQSFRKCGTKVD